MSDSIGHIIKDSLGDQLTHSPSKSFVNRCETRLRLLLLFLVCSLFNFVSLKAHQGLIAGTYTAEFDYDVVGTLAAARYNETDILYKLPDRIGNIYPDRFANARELLTRDIRELKRVYPEIPNSQLQELIDLNKSMYPEMNKPPRGKL